MPSTLTNIQHHLKEGALTMSELVQQYLSNIENTKELNAFVHIFEDDALHRAKVIDEKIKSGASLGKLFGAVISIKDNICMKGMPVSAASAILKGYTSPYSATAVQRLLDEDAIIIGSTNCDEFGMGSTSSNSCYGPVKNGFDPSLIAGGSSGGAAVSVQMDCCLMALGSDTGGSVRQPASLCNVIGMKPSYGTVSRYGLIAYGSSFDQIGILSKDIANINTCLQVIEGPDDFDSTMMSSKPSTSLSGKYAIIPAMFDPNNAFTEQIKNTAYDIIGKDNIEEVSFDYMAYLIPCYYILTTAEASSNLSRYDGVRYGHRAEGLDNLNELYTKSRTEGFGPEVKKRIMLGTFVLSEGYFDAYYTKAQKLRRLITDQVNAILEKYDAIIMPVTPSGAWPLDKKIEDPLEIYLSDVYTVLANITGMPAISLPINQDGSVVNIQLMGKKGGDAELLSLASKILK
jgi:aspartyl-tRNA(Asn)/glutamyl-tRNA(Gln) amidotransferase subunit A